MHNNCQNLVTMNDFNWQPTFRSGSNPKIGHSSNQKCLLSKYIFHKLEMCLLGNQSIEVERNCFSFQHLICNETTSDLGADISGSYRDVTTSGENIRLKTA